MLHTFSVPLVLIAEKMFLDQDLHLEGAAHTHIVRYLNFIHNLRDKFFGNARTVRKIVEEVIKAHDLRLAGENEELPVNEITLADAQVLKMDKDSLHFTRSTIGFRK